MKCPYNRKAETHVQQWVQNPNESGQITKGVTADNWTFEFADCEQENCGAWNNGHCCYVAGNLKNQ